MYSRRFILGSLATTAAMSALVTKIRPVRAAEPLRIRIGWAVMPAELLPIIPSAPQLTKHLGKSYMIELTHFAGTTPTITALASRAIDVGSLAFSSLPFAIENAKMHDLRIIADCFQDGVGDYYTDQYLVLKDSPVKTVKDLKGKVLVTNTYGSAVDIAMRAMLRKNGVNDRTDVNIIEAPFPTMKALLKEKKATLIPGVLPFSADPELISISRTLFTQKEAVGQTQMIVHVAREGFMQKNKGPMTDLLEDRLRLLQYFQDPKNHEETVQIIAKITKQPPARFEKWLFTKNDYYRSPAGIPNLKALQSNIGEQKAMGFLRKVIDVEKYADLSFDETAAKNLGIKI